MTIDVKLSRGTVNGTYVLKVGGETVAFAEKDTPGLKGQPRCFHAEIVSTEEKLFRRTMAELKLAIAGTLGLDGYDVLRHEPEDLGSKLRKEAVRARKTVRGHLAARQAAEAASRSYEMKPFTKEEIEIMREAKHRATEDANLARSDRMVDAEVARSLLSIFQRRATNGDRED